MLLGETAGVLTLGLAAGGAISIAAARLLSARLYGVAPQDPPILAAAFAVLLLAAMVAAYLPARRAARVDPMTVLHQQ